MKWMQKIGNTILIFTLFSCEEGSNKMVINDHNMSSTINVGSTVFYDKVDKIQRGDIVVFNQPKSYKKTCLRVVGLPGDRVEINNGRVFINGIELKRAANSQIIHTVYSKEPTDFSELKNYNYEFYSENYATIKLTNKQVEEIRINKLVDSVYELGSDSLYVFPGIIKTETSKYFNHYYFGPIIIPKVGDTVFEHNKMLITAYKKFENQFVVHENFYFCLGDSFSDAMDSRIIGLIPQKEIVGKVNKIQNFDSTNFDAKK